jgi:hypothetical protein
MPPRNRKPNEIAQQLMPLLIFGIVLVSSGRSFTFIDDEALTLRAAIEPVRTTLQLFLSGTGQHEHPPLYDLLLHFWLRCTGGAFEYLRVPSVFFFLVGIFLLARAAKRLGGPASAFAVIWLGVLWPYGFHYGPLAVWYSFSFFLVAAITLSYLRYLDDQSAGRWALLLLLSSFLIWTNYFGWVLLGCLAIDLLLRYRGGERGIKPAILIPSAAVLGVAFIPLFRAFRYELHTGMNFHQRALAVLANAAFCAYSFFVSESMAPWYWRFSVPVGLAVLVCLGVTLIYVPRNVRRFFFYNCALFVIMALAGILNTKRLLLLAPWMLLPIGVAIGANIKTRFVRIGLAAALLVITGIGWYGIYTRRFYSAPRFIEPWQQVAGDAATKINAGATVIGNSPSFFLYLTYALRISDQPGPWKFVGLLPDQVHQPHVLSPVEWALAGSPVGAKMIWIRGMNGPYGEAAMDSVAQGLDHACGARMTRLMMRDTGFSWKQRVFPELGESPWRIEVREYDCGPVSLQETYPIPVH